MDEIGAGPSDLLNELELATVADKNVIQAFEVDPTKVLACNFKLKPDIFVTCISRVAVSYRPFPLSYYPKI